MNRKAKNLIILVACVVSCLFVMTSCAKKQIGAGEATAPTTVAKDDKTTKTGDVAQTKDMDDPEKKKIRDFEAERIYFDFDKYNIKPEAEAVLKKKADFLKTNSVYAVLIAGNCDERGTNEYNMALGERRAQSAKKYLVTLGIPVNRLSTVSYGEERPVDPGHNEAAWAKNRNDTFTLKK